MRMAEFKNNVNIHIHIHISHWIGCPYYKPNAAVGVARTIRGITDIEDLKEICINKKICPYIVAREMMQFSAIIFAPYNYIIYPSIRSAMNIKLDHSVILFDEAHNILQTARDAASVEFTLYNFRVGVEAFTTLLSDMERATARRVRSTSAFAEVPFSSFQYLKTKAEAMLQWMYTTSNSLQSHHEDKHFTLEYGRRMLSMIQQWICQDEDEMEEIRMHIGGILQWYDELIQQDLVMGRRSRVSKLIASHENGLKLLDQLRELSDVIEYLYMMNGQYVSDFRLLIEKRIPPRNRHRGYQEQKDDEDKNTIFSLICLNAGIIFHKIKSKASSLILASGMT